MQSSAKQCGFQDNAPNPPPTMLVNLIFMLGVANLRDEFWCEVSDLTPKFIPDLSNALC